MNVGLAAARRAWREAVVNPLREGRLRLGTWPNGLVWLGAIIGYLYVLASAITVFAGPIRQNAELRVVANDLVLPVDFLPLIMCLIVVCLTLVQTAALHLLWPLRILALLTFATTVSIFAMPAGLTGQLVGAGALLALVVTHLVRIGKRYHSGELAVVSLIVLVGLQVPIALTAAMRQQYGFDWRGPLMLQILDALMMLASPALIAAGAVFTQLAVATGEAVADEIGRSRSAWWFWGALAVTLAWRGFDTVRVLLDSLASLLPTKIVGPVIAVALTAPLAFVFVARARRRHRVPINPGGLGEAFAPVIYLAGLATAAWLVLQVPFVLGREFLRLTPGSSIGWLDAASSVWAHPWSGPIVKFVAGLGLLAFGWWRAGRGDPLIGVLAAGYTVARGMTVLKLVTGDSSGFLTVDAAGLALAMNGATLLTLVALAVTARLDRRHATGVLAAALICTAYPLRDLIGEPGAVVLGFSTVAVLLFGLIWRVLTDGDFTHGDSPGLPRESRIILFLANSLFAASVLAFAALGRTSSSDGINIVMWESLGDVYAEALWLAAVMFALVSALWPRAFQPSDESANV